MAEVNKSQRPIDPAATAGAKVFLDSKDLPITYPNINPKHRTLIHRYIAPYEILQIRGSAVEQDIPNNMKSYDTVDVSRLEVAPTEDSRGVWGLPPAPAWDSRA
jgi:hypothetical protein